MPSSPADRSGADRAAIGAVAFDLMDTLVRDPYREALRAATGVDDLRALFRSRDVSAYPRFEVGAITEDEYWAVYTEAGVEVDVAAFHRVRRAGYEWLPGMRELLVDLAGHGVTTVVASNYPHWIDELREGLLAEVVDAVWSSHDLGVRKPDPAFYRLVADRLGRPPGEVAFLDDRPANVEAARDVGMPAAVADGAPRLRAWLRERGVPC